MPLYDAMLSAEQRLAAVRRAIEDACRTAGRRVDDVTLVAVSKTQPAEAILPLIEAGQRDFGENRVQEAAAKWPTLRAATPDLRLHLVGQLQSNKAEAAVALFDVIHSVDRPSLIAALAAACARQDRWPTCFVQVNLEGGAGKGGCAPEALGDILAHCRAARLAVAGLMCVPPEGLEPAPWFALLGKLADDDGLAELSMGMSGDYPTAVTLGATQIRVGSALFGPRA